MKTFKDLKFKPHSVATSGVYNFSGAKQATIDFENGYGVSVLLGSCFYSNGVNTYELAITLNGQLNYTSGITDDVLAHLTEDEVSDIMSKVQVLK